ncbi:MAG TPA: GrpB family protein [Solirubrobacterales bacterium]|nr:GrpB family protein [Solirubrobacterales bacterium]
MAAEKFSISDEAISLAPYDPAWPGRFERERVLLGEQIGPWVEGGIHHVGSTAVPGLEAKPTVDILVGIENLESGRACFKPLAQLDYAYAPYLPEEMHWFCKPSPARREFHLHLVPVASARFRDELAFRDLLRADPGLAHAYVGLKRSLAARFPEDREAYTEGKGEFVERVLGRAG